MMAEAQLDDDDDVFVYMGGDQQVPDHVRRARIHKSVKIVLARAFQNRRQLISVEFHDGVEVIEREAFDNCRSFKGPIKLLGVKVIKVGAFSRCKNLESVEFGDMLETIESCAFCRCHALTKIKMPSVRTVGRWAFAWCSNLSDVEFGEALRSLELQAFHSCRNLKRIALPLKGDMIGSHVFNHCTKLSKVDLAGGIHQTVASLNLESWRSGMSNEINSINRVLPTITVGETSEIQLWMATVISRLDRYKTEHKALLKEATMLLELALWKANLSDNGGGKLDKEGFRMTRGSRKRARVESCVTSGASIVIKNVLPFLQLVE